MLDTYDHRLRRIGHPVRSAIHKPQIGRLVVGWVTTSEYLLLYVFGCFFWTYHNKYICYLVIVFPNHPLFSPCLTHSSFRILVQSSLICRVLEYLSILHIYFVFTMVHQVLYQIEAFPFFKKFELGGKAQWYYASNAVPDSLTRDSDTAEIGP